MKKAILEVENGADNAKYKEPRQLYDWSVTNKGGGQVQLLFTPSVMQIGELKRSLRDIANKLDKFAKEWDVPNNLDGAGRARY